MSKPPRYEVLPRPEFGYDYLMKSCIRRLFECAAPLAGMFLNAVQYGLFKRWISFAENFQCLPFSREDDMVVCTVVPFPLEASVCDV